MSRSLEAPIIAAAQWTRAASRQACRASQWKDAGSPRHLFLGRPLGAPPAVSPAGGASAPPRAAAIGSVPGRAGPREPEAAELARAAAGDGVGVAFLQQEHGVTLWRVARADAERPRAGDGLSTDDPAVALSVQTADCVPILIADRRRGAVAAVHAGWRGTAAGIAPRAVEHLRREYGSLPEDLEAVLGPAIGGCCYEVGEEVRAAFAAGPLGAVAGFLPSPRGRWRIDLARANAAALTAAGLVPARIQILAACTRCLNARLHSYRAEGTGVGRNWSFIATPAARR